MRFDFGYWILLQPSVVTVLVPSILFLAGFAALAISKSWRATILPGALKLLAIALLCTPLMHVTSYYDDAGLHIAHLALLPYLYLTLVGGLDMRRQWFAVPACVWISMLVVDIAGAWQSDSSSQHWYWGVGGYGLGDGLVIAPLSAAISLAAVQWCAYLARADRQRKLALAAVA